MKEEVEVPTIPDEFRNQKFVAMSYVPITAGNDVDKVEAEARSIFEKKGPNFAASNEYAFCIIENNEHGKAFIRFCEIKKKN